MAITRTEMKQMVKKLGKVELEILWMKERLLPRTKASKKELEEIRQARKEIAEGQWISGDELIKQLN